MFGLCRRISQFGSGAECLNNSEDADAGDGLPEIAGDRGQDKLGAHILQPAQEGAVDELGGCHAAEAAVRTHGARRNFLR